MFVHTIFPLIFPSLEAAKHKRLALPAVADRLFATGTMVFSGIIMNLYPIRYIHMGRSMSRNPWFGRGILILLLLVMFTPYFGHVGLGCMVLYLLTPLVTGRVNPEVAARESRPDPIEEG